MTPRQRRNHIEALGKAASAPRKSWLGKSMLLTGIQSAWIKSLLTTWGEGVSGGTAPRLPRAHACWDVLKGGRWSDKALSRFTAALEQARAEGFRGPQTLNRAHAILWPQPATSIIDEAMHDDDVDFVEQSVLQALDVTDPVYIIGLQYYTTRKKISDITRELQSIAPWLTDWEARKRVRWCLEIFRAKVFLSTRKLLAEQS
ncbi:hypothetical protein EKO07_04015 [Enterobacter hormaechei subsp. xiangfangensis]|uniref:hypothetical protein n=1 Tax=Enterobacter hormaechei TaxID=158836 RepID=UPI000F83E9D5|nr:hypothetical protein [Enterobacter hormaechei]RTM39731.1 hypothetical protein EKO13_07530 [Enterobacter hormaechei subsp. xiangfangensis]RTM73981.1 hypothetical protein EKO07_04015 [Enterobacter hormaechei subsp. xiangfangensis]VAE11091.1 Uncharacterised protein [Enterobacter hormaechei]VAF48120.1 Uncharacterised protein [Enterobacter hormaechei]